MKKHYAWVIAFTGTLVLLLSHGFGRMSYSVILPPMKEGLTLTYTQVGMIGSGNFFGYLFLAVVGGFLAARFGTRRVIFVSLLVMGISLFLTGLSHSFLFAFFTRLITGIGNAGSYIPMMALPAAWFVAQKRGLAIGVVTLGTGIGLSITGLVLPYFISLYGGDGWRYAWYLLGVCVFLGAFICYAFLRDNPREKGLGMYGGEEEQKGGPKITLFSAWKDVINEKEIWKLGPVYLMYGFSYIIYLTFFIAYLTKEIGLTPKTAGLVFTVLGICSIFCGVIWGGISDRIGRRYGAMFAYFTLCISYLIFTFWKDPIGFYISAVIFGLTAFSIPVIMAAAAGDAVGGRLAPAGLGFITIFFGIGQFFAPTVAGWLKDTTGTFKYAFLLSALASLIGGFGSLILKRKTE
ncbi:MAG: MFS transporter [Desulfobacteraceae bacterium]|nr:MAG: MFS transporter [Desulfobacteraceae bacterium]